jgi:hypothetical protein
MSEQCVVKIDKAGNVTVEANGVRGKSCDKLTAPMQRALGATTGRDLKPEHFADDRAALGQGQG